MKSCTSGSLLLATVVLALSFLGLNQQAQACAKHTGNISTPTALSASQEAIEQPQPVLLPKKQSRTSSKGKLFVPAITSEVAYPLETK